MTITIELRPEQEQALRELSDRLHVDPQALVGAAVRDLLSQGDDDFRRIARQVVHENKELYDRLR